MVVQKGSHQYKMVNQVEEIHLVCRHSTNVTDLTNTHFISGWWVVAERHIKPGVVFALHEEKGSPSYLHGRIEALVAVESGNDQGRRVQVLVRRTPDPTSWKGGGSGTSGYLWSGLDVGSLPVVPTTLPEFLGGGNKPMKSLFEAKSFGWPKATALNARIGVQVEEGARLGQLKGILARLAAVLGEAPVPYAFVDESGMPWRLDAGTVARAIAKGWIEPARPGPAGRVRELFLSDNFRQGHAEVIRIWRESALNTEAAVALMAEGALPRPVENSEEAKDPYDDFDPDSVPLDAFRNLISALRSTRQGQPAFRATLLEAYAARCAVTGCRVPEALEAAHIIPYALSGSQGALPANGLLLRADIHALFDGGLIGFRPESDGKVLVEVSPVIAETMYGKMHARELRLPKNPALAPSRAALTLRRERFPLRQDGTGA